MEIIGKTRDLRTNTIVLYTKIPVKEYIELIGEDFDNFAIQRKREKHKVYTRMKNDIRNGALLPGITLAVKSNYVDEIIPLVDNFEECTKMLSVKGKFDILDGLQRTYILSDLYRDGVDFSEDQELLVEFWLEKDEKHLIYRLLVLNAGQKPMSSRHQVEILFSLIRESLEEKIDDLELYSEKDGNRRNGPRKYQFDRIANGYQCFLSKNPEVRRENIIAERIQEDSVLLAGETEIKGNYDVFVKYLELFCKLDSSIYGYYSEFDDGKDKNWCNDSTVVQSFFAAIGKFGINPSREARCERAINKLIDDLNYAELPSDPLGVISLNEVKKGINSRKKNVGAETRKILTRSFQEFFREEGEIGIGDIWSMEAD